MFDHRQNRIRIVWLSLQLAALSAFGEPVPTAQVTGDVLEDQLASTRGAERADLLVELTLRDARGNPTQALVWGREALGLLAQSGDLRGEIRVINALCQAHLAQDQNRNCVSLAERALSLARRIDDREGLAEVLSVLGKAHSNLTEIHRSFRYYDEAVELFDELNRRAPLAEALVDRCFVQSRRGQYSEALQDCIRGRDLYEQLGDLDGLTRALLRIGNISAHLGQSDEALQHYLHLLDLNPSDAKTMGVLLNNIGFLYLETGKLDSAVSYLTKALEHHENIGSVANVIRAFNNLGEAHRLLGDTEKALSYFRRALEKANATDLKRSRSSALANMGLVQRDRGHSAAAIEFFEQAVDILQGTGESRNLRHLLEMLSTAYSEAGRDRKALEAFREYSVLNREAYNRQTGQVHAELQARLESEQQQRELELLRGQQAVADLELKRQAEVQRFLAVGIALILCGAFLWSRRSRLSAQTASMEEAVKRERAMNDRLRELDQLKDEFLANTSHELKTPLYGITGLAESLLSGVAGDLPAVARSSLGSLVASGRRLSEQIDALLDFSSPNQRPDSGQAEEVQASLKTQTEDLQQRLGLGAVMTSTELAASSSEESVEDHVKQPDFDGIRVLVVDDEPINLQVISGYLSPEGIETTTVANPEEALRRLEAESFDLVLLDVMMPELSGYDVCRKLRQKYSFAELPVIFLTVKSRDSDWVNGMASGANDYLTKPVSRERLLARVRPHLELLHLHRNREELVEEKISEIKVLSGFLPICGFCKKIRDDEGFWSEVEQFIDSRSEVEFSQSICPECSQLSGTNTKALQGFR